MNYYEKIKNELINNEINRKMKYIILNIAKISAVFKLTIERNDNI